MDSLTRVKSDREQADIDASEPVLALFPERFQLFGNISHDLRAQLAARLGLTPAIIA